jgi:hypothetical protein
MTEGLSQIIRNGWETWKVNLILCVPFIIRIALLIALFIPIVLALTMHFNRLSPEAAAASSEALNDFLREYAFITFPIAALSIIAVALVFSFFQAGAVEMSKEAIEKGTTNLDTMWSAGKKKFLDMFFSYILTILIVMGATIIAGLPFFLGWANPTLSGLLFGLGLLIAFAVLLLATLATALIPYALVIDDLGPVDSVKASISFFRTNPLDIVTMVIAIFLISFVASIISLPLSILPIVGSLVNTFINQVIIASLSTIWFTRLYMSGTGKLPIAVENSQ